MRSVELVNPSGRTVRVADNRVHHLLEKGGFTLPEQPAPAPAPAPSLEDMSRDELAEMAREQGKEFHPRLGKDNLIKLIEE